MKQAIKIIFAFNLLPILNSNGQQAHDLEMIYHWEDTTIVPSFVFGNPYNEVWGYVFDSREYAIIGSTDGTHVFDITDSASEHMVAYVPAPAQGGSIVHRDYHDYNQYLYAVCDEENGVSTLQIMNLRTLPDSVELVYDSHVLFSTSHNIFIDTARAKLYVCGVRDNVGTGNALSVYSLLNPVNPVLLYHYNIPAYIHDIYVRQDTGYCNAGSGGLFVVDFSGASPNTIGSLPTYPFQGYNHSGWLSDDGNTYIMCDETHGYEVKMIDVSDRTDPTVITTFQAIADSHSIPHNVMIKDSLAYISWYYEGLQIFNIADPTNPHRVAWYDTYAGPDISWYEGNWGVYCYLPSGKILVSDMQTGLYVFKFPDSLTTITPPDTTDTSTLVILYLLEKDVHTYPNPVSDIFSLVIRSEIPQKSKLRLTGLNGSLLYEEELWLKAGRNYFQIPVSQNWPDGVVLIQVQGKKSHVARKFTKVSYH